MKLKIIAIAFSILFSSLAKSQQIKPIVLKDNAETNIDQKKLYSELDKVFDEFNEDCHARRINSRSPFINLLDRALTNSGSTLSISSSKISSSDKKCVNYLNNSFSYTFDQYYKHYCNLSFLTEPNEITNVSLRGESVAEEYYADFISACNKKSGKKSKIWFEEFNTGLNIWAELLTDKADHQISLRLIAQEELKQKEIEDKKQAENEAAIAEIKKQRESEERKLKLIAEAKNAEVEKLKLLAESAKAKVEAEKLKLLNAENRQSESEEINLSLITEAKEAKVENLNQKDSADNLKPNKSGLNHGGNKITNNYTETFNNENKTKKERIVPVNPSKKITIDFDEFFSKSKIYHEEYNLFDSNEGVFDIPYGATQNNPKCSLVNIDVISCEIKLDNEKRFVNVYEKNIQMLFGIQIMSQASNGTGNLKDILYKLQKSRNLNHVLIDEHVMSACFDNCRVVVVHPLDDGLSDLINIVVTFNRDDEALKTLRMNTSNIRAQENKENSFKKSKNHDF